MKALTIILLLCIEAFYASAFHPFPQHSYKKLFIKNKPMKMNLLPLKQPQYYILRYKTPKGAVFCRMEEKITKVSGLWLKISIGNK